MKREFIIFYAVVAAIILGMAACSEDSRRIEDDKLGFIQADVRSEDTNLAIKPRYRDDLPGESKMIRRSFKNAPPLIPHTTEGFFPIQKKRNVCLSCHMPERAKKIKARSLPDSHFTTLRAKPVLKDGVYHIPDSSEKKKKSKKLYHGYFNCSQCHVPQAEITAHIKNLFTQEIIQKIEKNKQEQAD